MSPCRDARREARGVGIARGVALALGGALYATVAAAALVFGQVSGIDKPNDEFQVSGNGQPITVRVNNYKYEVVLPPGQYTATYKGKRATIVSYPSSTRQDISFK